MWPFSSLGSSALYLDLERLDVMHERIACWATGRIRHCLAAVMVVTLAAQTHGQKLARLPPVTSTPIVGTTGAEDLRHRIQPLDASIAALGQESIASSAVQVDTAVFNHKGHQVSQPIQLASLTDSILQGDYSIDIGGYVKADLIHDFNAIGSTDAFDPLSIPTDGRPGENTRLHARQTRLNLDFRTHEDCDELRLFIEGDFFGVGDALRLRHAYVRSGRLLAGQTWSTFMDESIIPRTIDFESPRSVILDRRGLLRWTQPVTKSLAVAVAVEDPQPVFDVNAAPAGEIERAAPDLVGRVRYETPWGHLQSAGLVRMLRFRQDSGAKDDTTGWGFNFTGRVNSHDFDSFVFQFAFGEGIESYRQAIDAAVDTAGDLEVLPVIAWLVAYEIDWTDRISSTFVYSTGRATNASFQLPAAEQAAEYVAANIILETLPRLSYGVEYLYGTRTDRDDTKGEAHRVQFSVRYDLP